MLRNSSWLFYGLYLYSGSVVHVTWFVVEVCALLTADLGQQVALGAVSGSFVPKLSAALGAVGGSSVAHVPNVSSLLGK